MIVVEINNNNVYQLHGKIKKLNKIYQAFKVKHPNAFFLRKSGNVRPGWDGCIDYVSDTGKFKAGLFQRVVDFIENNLKDKVEVVDNRVEWKVKPKIPKKIGNQIPRGYQKRALSNLMNNVVGGINHYVGVQDAATNAGKTTLMAGIHLMFRSRIPTIILLKDGDLFDQFKRELPVLLPKEKIGFVRGKNIDFQHVTVVMVQTLSPKAKLYVNQLAKFGICLVDEADEGDSKTFKNIITHLFNCKVRVGLSGSIYMSKYKKDECKNMNLRSFFGDVIFKITKKEMSELGYSTPVVVRLWPGSTLPPIPKDFKAEYDVNISQNKDRAIKCVNLVKAAIKRGRIPGLVVYRFHEHGEFLLKHFRKRIKNKRIELVHGDTKNRKQLLADFREGKIDILISSFIVKRGKNFPMIRYILNASATDSNETVSQVMGRGERTHDSKRKYYLDDFMDMGGYIGRHSRHRLKYYKAEGFKVIIK